MTTYPVITNEHDPLPIVACGDPILRRVADPVDPPVLSIRPNCDV